MEIKMLNVTLVAPFTCFFPQSKPSTSGKNSSAGLLTMQRYLVIDRRCCKACTAAHYLIYQQRAPASPLSRACGSCGESSDQSEIQGSQWGFSRASSASQSSFSKKFSFRNWGVSMTSWKSLPLTANANDKGHGTATLCFSKTKQKVAGWYSYRLRQPGPTNKQDMVPASA